MAHNSSWSLTQTGDARTWTLTQDGESRSFTIAPGVGPAGPAGPSNITTATETDITGILKGDGSNVAAAIEDTDYQGVPAEGAFADGDKTKLDGIEAGADVTDATNVDAAGAVMESDYSPAHSVLAQQSGTGSPSAVSLGTNSLLGRSSGAGTSIQGLTAAQARALLNVEDGATADQTDAEILAAVESESGRDLSVDGAKLDGIESGATADQTGAEIKSLYEAELDTNAFTDAEKSKLAGIEGGATADQTDNEILTAWENATSRSATIDGLKLDSIEPNATADQTPAEILTAIKTVDGTGSGLDADLLDGQDSAAFATSAQGALADSAVQPGDNLEVLGGVTITAPATAGQYLRYDGVSEFRNSAIGASDLPDLSSTYATAAQGTLADSAVQPEDIDTLAELNAIVTDATLIDTTDSRLSDARTPTAHTHTAEDLDFAGSTDIGADLADADEVLISDGGGNTTRRKSAISRLWTYIKAKIESVGLSSLNISGNLTVDTNTLQVNATTNEVTIAQDLYSQSPTLVVNGFSGFDGGLGVFSVNAGTWNGSVLTGSQSFSGQVELTGQAASTDDSAMTRSLVDQNRTLVPNCIQLHSMTGAASGTGATTTNDFLIKGDARLRCGSSAGAYASMWFAKNITAQTTSRIDYSRRIELGGVVHFTGGNTIDGVVRVVIGASNTSAVPPLADVNAMTAAGIGIEFDFDSGSSNKRARIIYHDGTTYKQSAWVTYITTSALGSRPVSYQITNVGDGNIELRVARNDAAHYGPNPLNNIAASVSVSDGPTGQGNLNEVAVLASSVQNTSTYVNYETALFSPMLFKMN